MDKISNACLLIFDALVNDEKSESLIERIDGATSDNEIKQGIREGVERLRELGQTALANQIENDTKGFAF